MPESVFPCGDAASEADDSIDAALALAFRPRSASPPTVRVAAGVEPSPLPQVPAPRYRLLEETAPG